MTTTLRGCVLLVAALVLALAAQAQQAVTRVSTDLAVTYNTERAKVVSANCGCFWLQGGSVDAAVPLFRGLGAAATLAGEHTANIVPGLDLSKLAFMAGPRYSISTSRWTNRFSKLSHGTSIFGEALFGTAHGFDGSFATQSGFQNNANSLSMQFGGGLNIGLARNFGVRAIELDYVRTRFRNLADDSQNDLRLAFGVTYHLGGR
jgi:opacity protein-like surface antigen